MLGGRGWMEWYVRENSVVLELSKRWPTALEKRLCKCNGADWRYLCLLCHCH